MKFGFVALKAQWRVQLVVVMDLGFAVLEKQNHDNDELWFLSSWCWKFTRKKENMMMRSWAPHCHGASIWNSKSMLTSLACCRHGLGLYNVGKQNHDDGDLWLVIIVVRKAHVKRRKHNDKEELGYAILEARWQTELVVVMDLGFAAL